MQMDLLDFQAFFLCLLDFISLFIFFDCFLAHLRFPLRGFLTFLAPAQCENEKGSNTKKGVFRRGQLGP